MPWLLIMLSLLHLGFAICEMFPWSEPFLLQVVLRKLELTQAVEPPVMALLAVIVKNAGIYNAILSGLLFWAAFQDQNSRTFSKALCIGVAVAGAFGTATLDSLFTAFQCFAGIAAFIALSYGAPPRSPNSVQAE